MITYGDIRRFAGVQARGNAVEVCGPQTGHSVRAIAFCDSTETASAIAGAIELALREIENAEDFQ